MGMAKEPGIHPVLSEQIAQIRMKGRRKRVDLASDSRMGAMM
jgi:hypothetical protein